MSNSKIIAAQEWLKSIKQPFVPNLMFKTLQSEHILNPTTAYGTCEYVTQANATASTGTAPQSIFEGMQTIANLARTAAGFNPLDPEGTGDKAHFIQFSQNIADAPFLSLLTSNTVEVEESSMSLQEIIDSLVNSISYRPAEEHDEITQTVINLLCVALSYGSPSQQAKNLAINLLQPNNLGVEFHLYSFGLNMLPVSIDEEGNILYDLNTEILQSVYQLSQQTWDLIKPSFEAESKTTLEDWLNSMTTPLKEVSVNTPCLT